MRPVVSWCGMEEATTNEILTHVLLLGVWRPKGGFRGMRRASCAQESESDAVRAHSKKVKKSTCADQTSDQEVTELTEDLEAYDMFLRSVELCELGDFETSWKAYRAGCTMLEQVSVATLDAQVACAVQHQADVRVGLELLERLRRKGLLRSGATALSAPERIVCGEPLPKARLRRQRHQHNTGEDGFLTTNRSGYSLCPGWQDGTCNDSHTKGWCRRLPGMAHQEHGTQVCQHPAAKAPRSIGTWTGYVRSRGGGKSGGWPPNRGGCCWPGSQLQAKSTTSTTCIRLTLLPRRLQEGIAVTICFGLAVSPGNRGSHTVRSGQEPHTPGGTKFVGVRVFV